jgi:hypothetical protein
VSNVSGRAVVRTRGVQENTPGTRTTGVRMAGSAWINFFSGSNFQSCIVVVGSIPGMVRYFSARNPLVTTTLLLV